MTLIALVVIFAAFTLSATAGMGGSLIMVPGLVLILGAKQGIALSALLLATNNVGKVIAYRQTIPWRKVVIIVAVTIVGSYLGVKLLIDLNDDFIYAVIVISMLVSFAFEKKSLVAANKALSPVFAFFSGGLSGISGTSGPLKGVALRALNLERMYLVGAASVVSLTGDAVKSVVFIQEKIITGEHHMLYLLALPVIPVAVYLGRHINREVGEKIFAGLFWIVMAGYAFRFVLLR